MYYALIREMYPSLGLQYSLQNVDEEAIGVIKDSPSRHQSVLRCLDNQRVRESVLNVRPLIAGEAIKI